MGITYDEDGLKGADKSAFLPGLCPVFRRCTASRGILFQDILQKLTHRTECLAAMRNRVLFLRRQLRRGLAILREVEDRIISETMLPLRLMGDQALEDAFCVEDTSVCKCSADIAGEVCRAFIPLRIAKLMDDACILHIIRGILTEVAGTVNARKSQHVINTKAGVVRHDDVIVLQHMMCKHIAANADGLQLCVLRKGLPGLDGLEIDPELTLRNNIGGQIPQDLAHLCHFIFVMGSKYDSHASLVSFCPYA